MTTDERIEKLLNRYGQTISDLPYATDHDFAYAGNHRHRGKEAAFDWGKTQEYKCTEAAKNEILRDYICHLCDVIDRMEAALETAANNAGCDFCDKSWNECKLQPNNEEFICDFRLDDEWLI